MDNGTIIFILIGSTAILMVCIFILKTFMNDGIEIMEGWTAAQTEFNRAFLEVYREQNIIIENLKMMSPKTEIEDLDTKELISHLKDRWISHMAHSSEKMSFIEWLTKEVPNG